MKESRERQQSGDKPSAVRKDGMPPAGRKTRLRVCTFDKAERVKSAFALLSQKVTKEGLYPDTSRTANVREGSMIMRRIRRL